MKTIYSSLLIIMLVFSFAACKSTQKKRLAIWDTESSSKRIAIRDDDGQLRAKYTSDEEDDDKSKDKAIDFEATMKAERLIAQSKPQSPSYNSASIGATADKDVLSRDLDNPKNNSMFQRGNYTPENSYSGAVNKYNVVIAALATKKNADRLKSQLMADNENVFLAKNDIGLNYLVVGTYDNKDEAVKRASSFLNKYMTRYTRSELQHKYRIPFEDIWILIRDRAYAQSGSASSSSASGGSYRTVATVSARGVSEPASTESSLTASAYKPAAANNATPAYTAAVASDPSSRGLDARSISGMFKNGYFSPESAFIASTKKYNVVVASFPNKQRAERTKKLLQNDSEYVFIGDDNGGNTYVVIGSYDTKEEAYNRRVDFMIKYINQYSKQQLKSKYGNDFSDTWVLVK